MSSSDTPTGPAAGEQRVTVVAQAADGAPVEAAAVRVTVRRAPRFVPFVLTGVLLGLVAAAALLAWRIDPAAADANTVITFVGAVFALLGGVGGAGLAVLADRRSR